MSHPVETVYGHLLDHANRYPDKVAAISGEETLTYADLAVKVCSIARETEMLGVSAGDLVGVESGRALENLVGLLGCMALGAVPVSLPNEIRAYQDVVADASPRAVLVTRDGMPEDATADSDIPRLVIREGWHGNGDLVRLERSVLADDPAMIYYTSGTTSGVRKGVIQPYSALAATGEYITSIMQMNEEVCEFVASPVDNAFWFGRCRCVLKVGGTMLLSKGTLNPLQMVGSIQRNAGNAIAGDTPVFMMLLRQLEKYLHRIGPQLRWAKIASQAMPVSDKERLASILVNARIVMNYGLTEAMRTAILPFSDHPDKLASVGRPSQGVNVRVESSDGGDSGAGETGEILISGSNLAMGYWNKPDLWSQRFQEGWYRSGDIGHLDEDGFLYIQGRSDQAINVGGKTIALGEVEDRIRPTLKTDAFAVCGIDDPRGVLGEIPILVVEGEWTEEVNWTQFRIDLFQKMEASFVPREAYSIDRIPRTTNGKVQTGILREKIQADGAIRLS